MNNILGPAIGHTTSTSSKIWIYRKVGGPLFVKVSARGESDRVQEFKFISAEIPAAIAEFTDLNADTKYSYEIFTDRELSIALPIPDLESRDLYFWTMPKTAMDIYRYDFLVLSCHNPVEAEKSSAYRGRAFGVWEKLPKILKETVGGSKEPNPRVLFAILGGDQIYGDYIQDKVLNTNDAKARIDLYIGEYVRFWSNPSYRKILASTPSYLMWDDHDITDGWGSRDDSYISGKKEFLPEWRELFNAGATTFSAMQASRNPKPLSEAAFDCAFRVGSMGFFLADLRSNRNAKKGELWLDAQFENFRTWVEQNRQDLEVLFFVSPVVFAHGAPEIEEGVLKHWHHVVELFSRAQRAQLKWGKLKWVPFCFLVGVLAVCAVWFLNEMFWTLVATILLVFAFIKGLGKTQKVTLDRFVEALKKYSWARKFIRFIIRAAGVFIPPAVVDGFLGTVGDLRDDVEDAWAAPINAKHAESLLDHLFSLQNDPNPDKRVHAVILSGDIHSAGYSNIYSANAAHSARPVIPHIVASPVAYPPFPWIGEALYRKFTTGSVTVGSSGRYTAQIAHHFTERNVVVCSLRKPQGGTPALKAKFYVEGFSEPQTAVFDLEKSSHLERIQW